MSSTSSFPVPTHLDSTSDEDQDELDDNWEDWDEDAAIPTPTLIYPSITAPSVQAALAHDLCEHGFCFKSLVKRLQLDTLSRIKLINWIRAGDSNSRKKEELEKLTGDEDWLVEDSDQWMIPRLPGDGMLQFDFDEEEVEDPVSMPVINVPQGTNQTCKIIDLSQRLFAAEQELAALRALVKRTLGDVVD